MSAQRATFIAKKVFLRSIREKQLTTNKFIDGDSYDLIMIEHRGCDFAQLKLEKSSRSGGDRT